MLINGQQQQITVSGLPALRGRPPWTACAVQHSRWHTGEMLVGKGTLESALGCIAVMCLPTALCKPGVVTAPVGGQHRAEAQPPRGFSEVPVAVAARCRATGAQPHARAVPVPARRGAHERHQQAAGRASERPAWQRRHQRGRRAAGGHCLVDAHTPRSQLLQQGARDFRVRVIRPLLLVVWRRAIGSSGMRCVSGLPSGTPLRHAAHPPVAHLPRLRVLHVISHVVPVARDDQHHVSCLQV